MKLSTLTHEFVKTIPPEAEHGKLYISIEFATAVHLCACGCGNKVVTPISPAQWLLTYDGESVSLSPSIGNWQFPCRSHYWVRNNRIRWGPQWTDAEIAAGRARDQRDVERHYSGGARVDRVDYTAEPVRGRQGLFARLWRWIMRRGARRGDP